MRLSLVCTNVMWLLCLDTCALAHLIDESGWSWQAGQRLGVDGALLRGHVVAEILC